MEYWKQGNHISRNTVASIITSILAAITSPNTIELAYKNKPSQNYVYYGRSILDHTLQQTPLRDWINLLAPGGCGSDFKSDFSN